MKKIFGIIFSVLFSACALAEFKMFVDAGRVCNESAKPLENSAVFLLADLGGGNFEDFSLVSGDELKSGEVLNGALVVAQGHCNSQGACCASADIELEGNEFLGGGEAFALLVLDGNSGKVSAQTKYLLFRKPQWIINSENRGVHFYSAISVSAGGDVENSLLFAAGQAQPSPEDLSDIKIESQPESAEVFEKQKCEFKVSAYDVNGKKLIYAWQVDKGGGWVNAGSSKDVLKVSATLKNDGFKYRCKIQNEKNGEAVYTSEALLTVRENVKITEKPKSLTVFEGGENAGFYAAASGYDARYQWQEYVRVANANGKLVWVWRDIEGATSQTFIPQNANLELDGRKYRCKIYNGGGEVFSGGVKFAVLEAAKISGVKILQNKEEVLPSELFEEFDISLNALASGYKIKFQWQVLEGGDWSDVKKATGSALKISKPTAGEFGGKTFRCKVYNDGGAAYSEPQTLQISQCPAPASLKGRALEIEFGQNVYALEMSSAGAGILACGEFSSKASVSYKRNSPKKASLKISANMIGENSEIVRAVLSDKNFDFTDGDLAGAKVRLLPLE
ncbi:MAG: hypothetical protein IKO42_06535 [Opitutales bacterium]|nr:hypothetical protein [Opitutales bacterium]